MVFLTNRTEADFDEYRKHSAWTVWKYAMWDLRCKLPTQLASGQSRCFCGAVIDIMGMSQHVHVVHMEAARSSSRPAPFNDPDAAARKLMEIANSVEPVQDGRIHIEKINGPFQGFRNDRIRLSHAGCSSALLCLRRSSSLLAIIMAWPDRLACP